MKKRRSWIVFYCLTIAIILLFTQWGSRAVTTFSEKLPITRKHCIIIDPGHGGEDGGAISCTGIPESTYNLEIALRLNDLFHLLGYDTQMIRTTDISVYTKGQTLAQKKASDLKKRVAVVNETENAILLSIHQNKFSDERYNGAQVFYADTQGSDLLAKQLQSAFTATLNPGSSRLSKECSGVYLMEHINCTGVLIECGFLSNVKEEALLRSSDYQQKLCCVIAANVSSFLSNT